jgi:WD40 repeat protein
MRIISLPSGKEVGKIKGLATAYNYAFTPDSSGLLLPRETQLWDLTSLNQPKLTEGIKPIYQGGSARMVFSPDSKLLAVASAFFDDESRGGAIVWGIEKRAARMKIEGLASAAFSADSRRVAGVGGWLVSPQNVVVPDTVTGKTIATIDPGKIGFGMVGRDFPTCVALSPDGTLVAIGTTDGKIMLRPLPGGGR